MFEPDRLDALRVRYEAHPTRYFASYADLLRRAGRPDEAVAIARPHLDRHPDNVWGQVVLARALRDLGHPEEAGIAARLALSLDPTDPLVVEVESLVAYAPTAIAAEERDLGAHPALPDLGGESGGAVDPMRDGALDWEPSEDWEAIPMDDPEEVIAASPVTPPVAAPPATPPPVFVTETMAELYVQQGLPDRAEAIYRELAARAPDDPHLARRHAEVLELAREMGARTEGSSESLAPLEVFDALTSIEEPDSFEASVLLEESVPFDVFEAPAPLEALDDLVLDVSDPSEPEAFDFSRDADVEAPEVAASDAMLAGLSFEAFALDTPGTPTPARATTAAMSPPLEMPPAVGRGPSAREALRTLAQRSFALVSAPSAVAPTRTPPATAAPEVAAGDDFDQWLRGLTG